MGKRRTYITIILTVGSLAWTMYALPDQISAVEEARGRGGGASGKPNGFQTIPDVEAALGLVRELEARQGTAGEGDAEAEFVVYAPVSALTDADRAALAAEAKRRAPVKRVAEADGR
jgi:hypothetical protein